jgi:hypothetical protein
MFNDFLEKELTISFIEKSYSKIFKIENFLSEEQYKLIDDNIPKFKSDDYKILNPDFDNKEAQHQLKFHLNEVSKENYEKYVYSNPILENFVQTIKNPIFVNKILNKLFYKILASRIKDKKTFLKLFIKKNRAVYEKKKSFIDKFIYNNFISTVEFAYMLNGAESFPHTDGMKKIISLMLYFPEKNFSYDIKKNLGTSFFKSNEFGLRPNDIIGKTSTLEETKKFKERNKIETTFPFEKKTLFGFIKSHNSWHSVEKVQIPNDSIRKNININILLI